MQESPPRTVCVLGFGRSGTSLTMQVLKTLGVDLGLEDDLLHPQEGDNPRGYWEPRWMVELNDEILAHFGTTWWQPFPAAPGWQEAAEMAPLRERAQALFDQKLGGKPLGGWKDPRTTLTLPLWQKIAPDPLYVICVRNPIDAIASAQRRPEPTLSLHAWGELWLEYTARALLETTGKRRLLVFYEDYFRDLNAQVTRVGSWLGLAQNDERLGQATVLIERSLRHHRSSPVDLAAASGLPASTRILYTALRAAQDLRQGPRIDAESVDVCDAIELMAADLWQDHREAMHARKRAEALTTLGAQLEAARADAASRLYELTAARERGLETEAKLVDAHAQLKRRDQELDALRDSVSWQVTRPLRALKRGGTGGRGSRR